MPPFYFLLRSSSSSSIDRRFYSSSSSSQSRPSIGSPARIQKLIASQADPLLAKEIYELAASLRPDLLRPSLPSAYPALHTLVLKLARARRFSAADALLRAIPRPSPGLFSALFRAYSALGHPARALASFRFLLRVPGPRAAIRPRHFNRLLDALTPYPSALPAALALLKSADSLGFPTDARSHTILMHAFARSGRLSVVCALFDRMLDRGFSPDADSYRVLVQGLCRRSQVGTAAGVLEDMLNKGLAPDALACTTLLNSLCRKKRLREAYKLLCRMRVRGCSPDVVHYNTVILGFCREGRPLDACRLLDDMLEHGCPPNLVSYATLVHGLCREGLVEQASGYMEEMERKGLVPHFSLFHALAKGFYNVGKYEEAYRVVEQMLRQGVEPHTDTWMLIVPVMCNDSDAHWEQVFLKVVNKEEWRRSTKIVQAGPDLEEYLMRRLRKRKT